MRNSLSAAIFFAIATAPLAAFATPCPTVMIILDRSGSMDSTPDGSFGGQTKLDIAKDSINSLLTKFGDRIPFGYETFQSDGSTCTSGIDILVEPKHGASKDIVNAVMATVSGGGTNTGEAIAKAASDPTLKQEDRPSFILLITDGEPNCAGPGATEPTYTVNEIKKAATAGIKTFVIGFGQLPAADATNMGLMADAGGEPCTGAACNGKKFYAADSAQALNEAIDTISMVITGEIGNGVCDDSCYSNGCTAGQICVAGACKDDPCLNVTTCATGDYCYTDGTSPGTCKPACLSQCADGQICDQGTCRVDPCGSSSGVSCGTGQVCQNGNCVLDRCGKGCDPGLLCSQGRCIDDPCRYITCPQSTQCVNGTGACMSTGTILGSTTGPGHDRAGVGGCAFTPGLPGGPALIVMLLGGALAVISRRRPRS